MNQNHRDNHDENQNDHAVLMTPASDTPSIDCFSNMRFPKKKTHISRISPIIAATLLCSSLCFCSDVSTQKQEGDLVGSSSLYATAPGFDTSTDANRTSLDESTPLPSVSGGDYGLTLYDATNAMTAWYNFKLTRTGAYVVDFKCDEGFQYGDYVYSINGQIVTSAADVQRAFDACDVGDAVTVEIIRASIHEQGERQVVKEETAEVTVTHRKYDPEDLDVRFDMQP